MAWIVTLPLGPESQWVLNQELQRLAQVEEAVRQVDQRFAEATQGDPLVEKLLALPGVALVTAVILRAMIGRFDRFRNGKQLSRFCGLTPCNASSGKRQADAGLVNEGNELLCAAMIQLAKRLPGHDALERTAFATALHQAGQRGDGGPGESLAERGVLPNRSPAARSARTELRPRLRLSERGSSKPHFFERTCFNARGNSTTQETTRTRLARVSSVPHGTALRFRTPLSAADRAALALSENPQGLGHNADARIEEWELRGKSPKSPFSTLTGNRLS